MTKINNKINYETIAKMPRKDRAKFVAGLFKDAYKTQTKLSLASGLTIGAGAAVIYGAKNKHLAKVGEFLYKKAQPLVAEIKDMAQNAIKTIQKATPAQKGLGIVAAGIFLVGSAIMNIVAQKNKNEIIKNQLQQLEASAKTEA